MIGLIASAEGRANSTGLRDYSSFEGRVRWITLRIAQPPLMLSGEDDDDIRLLIR